MKKFVPFMFVLLIDSYVTPQEIHYTDDSECPILPNGQLLDCYEVGCKLASCPRQTGAECVSHCLGCIAYFYDKFGNDITSQCDCAPGENIKECDFDPCKSAKCLGQENIQCRTNRCGDKCKAVFYDKFGKVVTCSNPDPHCHLPFIAECDKPACEVGCPSHSRAVCRSSCNGCVARYYDSFENDITAKCPCQRGMKKMVCDSDPCKGAKCMGHKNIECRIDKCGGCKAIFYDSTGSNVKCVQPRCYLPRRLGQCEEETIRYYYNKKHGKCLKFIYRGCLGNMNNFETLRDCQDSCLNIDVCLMRKERGPCQTPTPRFYHDQDTGKCELFTYGGCRGNSNNFKTIEDCQERCPDVCSLPKKVGPCEAAIMQFFFNKMTGKCEEFLYGGCEGNANRFETIYKCRRMCQSDTDKICQLPVEGGTCRAAIPRYFFNDTSKKCETFLYGGCDGNGNNFQTLQECMDRCPEVSPCSPESRSIVCDIPACKTETCPRQSGVECRSPCNKCIHHFYDKFGNEVTDQCPCPAGSTEVVCFKDPCDSATCAGYNEEDVDCRSSRCGACEAQFYNRNGKKVTCEKKYPVFDSSCPFVHATGGTCAEECFSNEDCNDDMICCYNGCGSHCRNRYSGTNYDPSCPTVYGAYDICVTKCQSNDDCRITQICCSVGCGSECLERQIDSRCPPLDQQIMKNLHLMSCPTSGCRSNSECEDNEICCFNGCQSECRNIPEYHASCPAVRFDATEACAQYCSSSSECMTGFMCCRTSCGSQCQENPDACPFVVNIPMCMAGGPCRGIICANRSDVTCRVVCNSCRYEMVDAHNRIARDCIIEEGPPDYGINLLPLPEN